MSISEIEDAIVNRLVEKVAEVKTVKGYEGEFAEIKVLKRPAALVVYEKGEYERRNLSLLRRSVWTILVVAEGLQGDKRRQGAYELLEKVREALWDFSPGEGCGVLELKKESLLRSLPNLVVFAQDYELKERIK